MEGLPLPSSQLMLPIHYHHPVDALKHFVKAFLEVANFMHYSTNLNDLLIAQEVETGKLLSLLLDVFRQTFH